MGEEIDRGSFSADDFAQFKEQLQQQTGLLKNWFEDGVFSEQTPSGGFELEAWLVDADAQPLPINETFIKKLNNDLVVPELAQFNIELNGTPQILQDNALNNLQAELEQTWQLCCDTAESLDSQLIMTGILATVNDKDLCPENMSRMLRYQALNDQVLQLREGKPLQLDINGHQHLQSTHYDVMLESAATSFQIHQQIPAKNAVRSYNAALVIAGPLLAVSTNSPYLFGKQVWEETRVPLFEQSVELGGIGGAAFGPVKRVSFGSGYMYDSLMECFTENNEHFPILLPLVGVESQADESLRLPHLRMHNGTIWRWVRPLIGFNKDGTPHLRIEQRVVPAGPTIVDAIANSAFFYGLMQALVSQATPIEREIDFSVARDNFYAAARDGISAQLTWQSKKGSAQALLKQQLIPLAKQGLNQLGLDKQEIEYYLGIIQSRIETGQTGSVWQRQMANKLKGDLQAMTLQYFQHQQSGHPVHEWSV